VRKLVEITFMSLDGVIDAPDITQEAQSYFSGDMQHDRCRIDMLCLIVYPFPLRHGTHLFDRVDLTTHLHLSDIKRFVSGAVVLEYTPKK
jgi:hypothetical protein